MWYLPLEMTGEAKQNKLMDRSELFKILKYCNHFELWRKAGKIKYWICSLHILKGKGKVRAVVFSLTKQSNPGYVCSEVSLPESSELWAGIVTTITVMAPKILCQRKLILSLLLCLSISTSCIDSDRFLADQSNLQIWTQI